MNNKKIDQLFAAARNEPAPAAPPDFAVDVLRAVRREPALMPAPANSMGDYLNLLFPRVALAAAGIIILCVAAELGLTASGLPGVTDEVAQGSSQYFFDTEDL